MRYILDHWFPGCPFKVGEVLAPKEKNPLVYTNGSAIVPISIEVDESLAKKFDTKAEAWDFVSLHYLKNKYQTVGVRACK